MLDNMQLRCTSNKYNVEYTVGRPDMMTERMLNDYKYRSLIKKTLNAFNELHQELLDGFRIFIYVYAGNDNIQFTNSYIQYGCKHGICNRAFIRLCDNIIDNPKRERSAKFIHLLTMGNVSDDELILRVMLHELAHILFYHTISFNKEAMNDVRKSSRIVVKSAWRFAKPNDILLTGNSLGHSFTPNELYAECYATQYYNYYRKKVMED